MSRTRYPGLNYFRPEDEPVFCGRAKESEQLYTKLMLYSTLVLHADSGAGKSSLIQAGLLPRLERELRQHLKTPDPGCQAPYLPVVIRLDSFTRQPATSFLIDETLVRIRQAMQQTWPGSEPDTLALPYLEQDEPNLWMIAKKLYAHYGVRLLLVFDQFEEIQACDRGQINAFSAGLLDMLSVRPPGFVTAAIDRKTDQLLEQAAPAQEAQEELNRNIRLLEDPLGAKAIFVVREDKLGVMSLINDRFPDILKNDFTLAGLDLGSAHAAITRPGLAVGDFISPELRFDDAIVDKILRQIMDQGRKPDAGTEDPRYEPDALPLNDHIRIDPLQLQIVCSDIERKIVATHPAAPAVVITGEHINTMSGVVEDYYADTWRAAKDALVPQRLAEAAFDVKRRKIISELVVADRRDVVHEARLLDEGDQDADRTILSTLTGRSGRKLLNIIKSGGSDTFYQLCHDRFVLPVSADILRLDAKFEAERLQEEALRTAEQEKQKALEDAEKERAAAVKEAEFRNKILLAEQKAALSEKAEKEKNEALEQARAQMNRAQQEADRERAKKNAYVRVMVFAGFAAVILGSWFFYEKYKESLFNRYSSQIKNAEYIEQNAQKVSQVFRDSLKAKESEVHSAEEVSINQNNAQIRRSDSLSDAIARLHFKDDSLQLLIGSLTTQLAGYQDALATIRKEQRNRQGNARLSAGIDSVVKGVQQQQRTQIQVQKQQEVVLSDLYSARPVKNSSWFKQNQSLQFGDIRIRLILVYARRRTAVMDICEAKGKGECGTTIATINLLAGKSYSFKNGNNQYELILDRIDNSGANTTKPAADITLIRQPLK